MLLLPLMLGCGTPEKNVPLPLEPEQEEPAPTPRDETPDDTPRLTLEGPYIVGYAVYWEDRMPDPMLLTHLNYAFAHIKSDFESLDIKNSGRLTKMVALKKVNPDLKVMLSVGGWGAGNFSEMAADETHRLNFCRNCLAAVDQYGLDGIDLDWEYPTSSAAGISHSPNDTRNFTELVKDLRATLGNGRLITMASADNANYVDFSRAMEYMDFVNVMAYDMGHPPYHNAALYPSSMTEISCDESVALHIRKGVPAERLVLGIPFYGHGDGKAFPESVDYGELSFDPAVYTACRDEEARVPYLTDSDGKMVLTYEDDLSATEKADYILQKGLLGAMYWNIEADDTDFTLSKVLCVRLFPQAE